MEQEVEQLQGYYQQVLDYLVQYSFHLAYAAVILLVGFWFAGKCNKWLFKALTKRQMDITLANFLANLLKVLVIIMVMLMAMNKLGISVTPLVAAIGAASLGAGLAIQGTLANYGAGLALIVTRPFVIGNTISVKGYTGLVKQIHLSSTIITNEDGEQITIPNRHIVGEIIANTEENSLVEGELVIGSDVAVANAVALLQAELMQHCDVQQTPPPLVGIEGFSEWGIRIGYRYWVATERLHQAKYQVNLALVAQLQSEGITIAQPQRQVTLINNPS